MKYPFLHSKKIRVLVNGIHAKSGGGVTYLRNILPVLAEDDELEIHLFLHREQFELFGFLSEKVRIHLLEYDNRFFTSLIWEQLALPILAKSMSVDVTFSPANYGPLLAPNQIIVLRNSLAVVGRETRLLRRFYWIGLALMTVLSLVASSRAIAVSQYAKSALTFGFGEKMKNKVAVINHGVNEIFRPSPATEREQFLLVVSDIYIQKNLHTLIEAMGLINAKKPNLRLKIAGRSIDAGYLRELKGRIEELGLQNVVEFLGERRTDELLELYQRCLVFVFPSTVETFGNPLVEAMACGTPVICSSTAAMPEIVGDAATFFSPLDHLEIADRILELVDNPAQLAALSARSLTRSKEYSWLRTARETANVIKEAARKTRDPVEVPQVQTVP